MLRDVENEAGAWLWPVMRLLLPPAGAEDPGRLPDDASDKRAEIFLSIGLAVNALDPNVRTQVNRVPGPAVSSPQRELKRDLAAGEEDTGQPRTRVGEGELGCSRYCRVDFTECVTQLIGYLHGVCLGTQLWRQHVAQLELNRLTDAGQFRD